MAAVQHRKTGILRRAGVAAGLVLAATLSIHDSALAGDGWREEAMIQPGHVRQSSGDFRKHGQDTSTSEFAFTLYCLSALSVNHANDAIRDCGEAISLNPNNSAAFKLRGLAYFSQHNLARAMNDFERTIRLDPNDPEAHAGRGAVLRERGDTRHALEAYSRAIELEPKTSRWWNARCWTRAIVHTDLQIALSDCNRAIAIDAGFVQAYDSRGLVYLQMGNFRSAVNDYTHALRLRPALVTALYGRGLAKLRLADSSGRGDIERARAIDPTIDESFRRYGFSVSVPKRSHVQPKGCGSDDCAPTIPLRPAKPAPENDLEPARSAQVDLNHGKANSDR